MKFLKTSLILSIAMIMVLGFASNVYCGWNLAEDDEEIFLTRIDSGDNSPLHETSNGVYGYWIDLYTFKVVIDFETCNGPVSPFTWDDVEWIPGSMDL